MIKTPLSTVIGGAGIWTPGCTVIGGQQNIDQLIKSLFADGTQGIYLNAQDSASIADLSSIKDLSGRNNHAAQPNATSRATLITDPSGYKSLKFDGVDDGYVTQSINFTTTNEITVIAAVKNTSTVGYQNIVEFSVNSSINDGAFLLRCPHELKPFYLSKGTVAAQTALITTPNLLDGVVLSAKSKISTDNLNLRVNGVSNVINTDQGAGNYGNYPLYIGRRGGTTQPFNGQIYALLVIGKLLDDATIQRIEKEFAKYIGVTL